MMHRFRQITRWAIALTLCSGGILVGAETPATSHGDPPASAPTSQKSLRIDAKKPDPKAVAKKELRDAINVLVKEYTDHLRDPKSSVRSNSDYFDAKPNPEITQEMILTALDGRYGNDVRIDAYVKWQLLSGTKGTFSEKLGDRLFRTYLGSSQPMTRISMDAAEIKNLQKQLPRFRKESDEEQLSTALEKIMSAGAVDNSMIFKYRDEFARLLPRGLGKILARFEDFRQRTEAGDHAERMLDELADSVQNWIELGGAQPADLRRLLDYLAGVQAFQSRAYPTRITFKSGDYSVSSERLKMEYKDKLKNIITTVRKSAASPQSR